MNPISILYLRSTRSPHIGGANRIIWETLNAIDSKSCRITPVFLINVINDHSILERYSQNGIDYYIVKGTRFLNISTLKILRTLIRSHNIDIVHSHEYKSNLITLLLKLLHPRITIISTIHGYFTHSLRGTFYILLDKIAIYFFDAVIIVTSALQKKIFYRGKKLHLLHNFIDIDKWVSAQKSLEPNNTTVIGFSGRISKEKGWKHFVDTACVLSHNYKNIQFKIAGDGPDLTAMKQYVSHKNLEMSFIFMGQVSCMIDFYNSIDILLAPSLTEGLPLAQMEACAMKIPVVATNVGGVSDLIKHGENGFLTPLNSIDILVHYCARLIDDPLLRHSMGELARKRVIEYFSSSKQILKYQQLYSSLC